MKPLKLNELIKLLESNGFTLIRSNGHMVYANGIVRLALAHQRVVSPGIMREAMRAIKMVQIGKVA
jgi:predicted RNA binding protein YcfA (HicA-like mRNA interferase family)